MNHERRPDQPARTALPGTLRLLMDYDWSGNVRELARVIQRALLRSDAQYLSLGT